MAVPENSVVGTKQRGDFLQELLVIGVQWDPPVQHLPADAQLWVAALEELEGDHYVCAVARPAALSSTASLPP